MRGRSSMDEDRVGMSRLSEHGAEGSSVFFTTIPQFGVTEYAACHDICETRGGDEEERSVFDGDPMGVSHDDE